MGSRVDGKAAPTRKTVFKTGREKPRVREEHGTFRGSEFLCAKVQGKQKGSNVRDADSVGKARWFGIFLPR